MSVPTRRILTPSGEETGSDVAKATRVLQVDRTGKTVPDVAPDISGLLEEILLEMKSIHFILALTLGGEVSPMTDS